MPVTELRAGQDPLDYVFDLPLDTQLVAKLFQNDDAGVAPLLKHQAGVVALSDAGAHLIYFCDAGFGLHFLAHWVRETGTFTLEEGVRRLTSDPARKYRIPQRGTIAPGTGRICCCSILRRWAITALERVRGPARRRHAHDPPPRGVHGVWVNGLRVFDGAKYIRRQSGPGTVIKNFDP